MLPPQARVDPVRESYFGMTVEDPYRWMEDWHGEELRAWVEAQGAYARGYFDALPERAALLARISELGDTTPLLTAYTIKGGRIFYLRRDAGEDVARLVMRDLPDGPERVIFDPATVGGEVHSVIDWYYPSHDGQLVAYGLSQGGSEDSVLHVVEADTGRVLADAISRTMFGQVEWLEDNDVFLYHRLAELPAGAPETDRFRDSRTFLHRLGDDPERDQPVFGNGINPRIELSRDDIPLVALSERSDWMIGVVMRGVQPELVLYAARRSTLSDPTSIPWVKVVDVEDGVAAGALGGQAFVVDGDVCYLRTFRGAPRFRVVALDLRQPDMARASTVIPESTVVVEDIALAEDYLLTRDLDAGIGQLRRMKLESGAIEPVTLPVEGTIASWATSPESGEVVVELSSWIVPPHAYRLTMDDPAPRDTGWIPQPNIDLSQVEAHETSFEARDGTMVPISIIHLKGLKLDGNNPTILLAYGSYGISLSPIFRPVMLAWYERGGVYAIAHVRGGGELGKEWHEAGRKLNKQNTINDFIDAAEYLIQQGYTRPDLLAGRGGSAGGVPSGGALVQRPDLWAVMVMNVTVTNFLRFEFSENGPNNVPEFGTIATEEGFRALEIIDSYTKIRDGVAYPACLLTTGLNDPRVVVWQAAKMAARLQTATSSGKPVLLRVEIQAGHGIGSTRRQLDEELADTLAFLLQQFGVREAEPASRAMGNPC